METFKIENFPIAKVGGCDVCRGSVGNWFLFFQVCFKKNIEAKKRNECGLFVLDLGIEDRRICVSCCLDGKLSMDSDEGLILLENKYL